MKRIAIDMDEVIANTSISLLKLFNQLYDQDVTEDELKSKNLIQVRPHFRKEIESFYTSETFFRGLDVISDSQTVILELQEQYEIFIATAAMEVPASFKAKYEWLKEHFPSIPDSHIVFCGDKSIIHADYLIDDNVNQLQLFRGKGILYSAPHNRFATGFTRVNNWLDVRALFMNKAVEVM
ncbi:5'(3')-deoxyribonucleotidase [Paenibacillus endophyticus]|uniref:5'(3')-deoxyribonucleotidase n=1 Tax=Paenibacillus endophyticus TaxID=1294268 RepID=A0A7W5CEQ7_9BACL|nr:5'-3'-deoxyribonucleotidase [Paenibacillus endophyticus]MBB3155910.1 5'(3')-deoxyribonucleotidase [Paenibacillus endophyticus]